MIYRYNMFNPTDLTDEEYRIDQIHKITNSLERVRKFRDEALEKYLQVLKTVEREEKYFLKCLTRL